MTKVNRDAFVATVLLLVCGILFWASFDIRQPDYGVLMPSTWPRVIITVLTILSSIYLFQSLRMDSREPTKDTSPGIRGFFLYWRNPIFCFLMFFVFLITLPILGMLIGGIAFVFLLMSVLGGWEIGKLFTHAIISIVTVGSMWSLFTFGLGVMLPEGIIFNPFAL